MSLKTLIRTGLTDHEWEKYWRQLVSQPRSQVEALALGLDDWMQAVVDEAVNRQVIERAYTGKRLSLRKAVLQVIMESLDPNVETHIPDNAVRA